jgi:hypothetical protein
VDLFALKEIQDFHDAKLASLSESQQAILQEQQAQRLENQVVQSTLAQILDLLQQQQQPPNPNPYDFLCSSIFSVIFLVLFYVLNFSIF